MLESLVASLLNRFLGSYVQNFDPKQLNIGIWGGDVQLKDLTLKREALDQLKLPINIVEGHLGQLVLQIPWSNLKNQPVKVLIQDVFVLAVPKIEQDYDAEDEERRAQILKLNKLEKLELSGKMARNPTISPEDAWKQQSFTESLVSKIIDNLQITIKNIHIRYEDQSSFDDHPFSVGISLQELSAISTDSEWDPSFIHDGSDITHKLTTLRSLSVYWNSDSTISLPDSPSLLEFMSSVPGKTIEDFQYILRPVSGVGQVTLNKNVSEGPSAKAQLIFDELGFVFDSDQYRDALLVGELFRKYLRTKEYLKFKPKVPISKDPKAWFKYAGDVVLEQVSARRRQWSWNYILGRRIDKLRYIELYKIKTANPPLPPAETDEYNLLESKYSFDDLRFFRSLAKAELKKEKAQLKPQAPAPVSWSSWIWGSGKSTDSEATANEPITITEEQEKEFYDAIEWDEKQASIDSIEGSREAVTLQIEAILKAGSFTLRRDPHGITEDVVQILFNGFKSSFYNRADSFLANMSLNEMRVDDGSTNSMFKQVVTVKPLSSSVLPEVTVDDCIDHDKDDTDTFFGLSYEHNPLDGNADSNLLIKMKSITVFYNTYFIENVVRFFQPPKSHSDTIGALLNAAGATVEEFRDLTRMGLEYALQEHKTLNLKLDIQAPLIIIPLDVTNVSSPCAVLDAGHISVVSYLASKEVIAQVEQKKSLKYTDQDWKTLESLMYDKYKVQLHSTQFLIGSNLRDTMMQLNANPGPTSVMEKLNLDFMVEVSILPEAQNITKFKASGNLPLFSASMSDEKYRILMQIIDKSIPNFNFDTMADTETLNDADILGGNEISGSNLLPDMDDDSDIVTLSGSKVTSTQKLLEFNFNIEKVDISLHRCIETNTLNQEPLIDLTLHTLKLDFSVSEEEMIANISLRDISIEDHMQKIAPSEITKIATSLSTSSERELLQLTYKRLKTDRVDALGQEISDQDISLSLSTLKFIVTPKSILTLLDFVLDTFTSPAESPNSSPELSIEDKPSITPDEAKLKIKIELHSIIIVLNDDGIKLATLQLDSADVNLLMAALSLKVEARIGQLSLHDEVNEGSSRESIMRQLVYIEGGNLADFKYQTFDPTTNPTYNSSIYFRAGSIKFSIVEEPLSRIVTFMAKFAQMKALYDSARLVAMNQAKQIEDANKIHFDVLISTPIVVIPRLVEFSKDGTCDTIVAHLGDIFARNEYTKLAEDPEGHTVNRIVTGIRAIKLSSDLNFPGSRCQSLEMIDNMDLAFDISYLEPFFGMKRPVTIISGFLSDTNIKLTEAQCKFLIDASSSFSRIISGESGLEEAELDELGKELGIQANLESIGLIRPTSQSLPDIDADQLSLSFEAKNLALTLYNHTANIPSDKLEKCSLSKFSLNRSTFKAKMKSNGDLNADIKIKSFTVHDTRPVKENKFSEIIPAGTNDQNQFSSRISLTGAESKLLRAQLTVNNPTIILALDYLAAMKSFADNSLPVSPPLEEELGLQVSEDVLMKSENLPVSESSNPNQNLNELRVEFFVKVSDASVILIANPKLTDSEAIVFKVEQFFLSQQDVMKLSVGNVGMFLCRMDKFYENRLRILDDFTLTTVMDSRGSTKNREVAKVDISCQPLVLRLSLRDILLALDIIQKASDLSSETDTRTKQESKVENFKYSRFSKRPKPPTIATSLTRSTGRRKSSVVSRRSSIVSPKISQNLLAEFEGLRFVLIGTVQELPVLDMCVKPFTVTASNWSADMSVNAAINTFVNIYNYEKSAWEPLIEPWGFTFNASRSLIMNSKNFMTSIKLESDKIADVTVTSQTIGIISKSMEYLSEDVDFLTKRRDDASLYRILNQTGYDLDVWIDNSSVPESKDKTEVLEGREISWSFDDWHAMRDNLSTDAQTVNLGVSLRNSSYDSVRKISVASVGEKLYTLDSESTDSGHKLLCEVVLDDTVKRIILRSALTFDNKTQIAIEIATDIENPNSSNCWRVEPRKSRSIPIDQAYSKAVSIRPDPSFGFQWSRQPISWQNLLNGPRSVSCAVNNSNSDVRFYFQVSALFDKGSSRSRAIPNMRIVLSPPVQIKNLLPFDFTYRIFDKKSGKDWINTLKQGAKSAVHVVEPSRLLLLSVHPQESGYDRSDFAVINAPEGDDFTRENKLVTRGADGQKLILKLHYSDDKSRGNTCKVKVYAPYLVLNKTGLDLEIRTKFTATSSQVQSVSQKIDGKDASIKLGAPKMWSFESDSRSNRANIKVGDSKWSDALSFDTLGKDSEIAIPSSIDKSSIYIGLHVNEGAGKYRRTKIVTLTPRFVLHNKLAKDVFILDPGSSEPLLVKAGSLHPIHFLRKSETKQLLASFNGESWSSPFAIENVGRNYLRMYKNETNYTLLQIDILVEDATLYLHIEDASNNWPYSIRNFTNHTFHVFQSNPYVDENGVEIQHDTPFTPIEYKISAKSVMSYAWDFPAVSVKELVIRCNDKQRRIQLAEIGSLQPMKIESGSESDPEVIVDLNVVADGPTQTLVISDYDPSMNLYRMDTNASQASGSSSTVKLEEDEGEISESVIISLEGLGISLINKQLQELCYVTFRGIELQYRVSEIYETFISKVKWMQIDNELQDSVYPILLYPSVVPQVGKEMESHPIFSGSISRVRDDSYGVLYLKYATVLLQQITVQLDEEFLFAMIDFFNSYEESRAKVHDVLCEPQLEIPEPLRETSGLDMYFEILHIQPAQMDLSFVRTSERTDEEEEKGSSENPLMFFFNVLTMALGNINDAPIRLNALLIENVHIPMPMLMQSISAHYRQNFFYQIHMVLGSADFLGNPVGLFNNMSSGFMDLFYEPYQGFIMHDSPQEFGIGLAKGGLSFMKKSVFGISDSVSKFTGSISKGLSAATMDQAYQARRNIKRSRNRPSHALNGIATGANSFVDGIASGISGLALAPVQGASQGGVFGFIKGVGKGIIGLPTKTAIGVLDMASNVSEGVRNTALLDPHTIDRVRPPRFVARDGIVRPYNKSDAQGQIWLRSANNGNYYRDKYVTHISLSEDTKVVIVTFLRIILLNTSTMTTEWEVRFGDLQTITMERTGVALVLRGGVQGPFIPIADQSSRRLMYKELAVVVTDFNQKYTTK